MGELVSDGSLGEGHRNVDGGEWSLMGRWSTGEMVGGLYSFIYQHSDTIEILTNKTGRPFTV